MIEPNMVPDPVKKDSQSKCESRVLKIRLLGRISFDNALLIQEKAISEFKSTGKGLPLILSLEHDPVITCGRSTNPANLLLSEKEYSERGIEVRKIDRGGDVTYHGPGQVVIYPILALRDHGLRVTEYVELLEEAMIFTCGDFGIDAFRREGMRGCWTEGGKIGAVGTAVKAGGITKHGLAFNVNPDLEHFGLIVPCGIKNYPVTRLVDLTNEALSLSGVENKLLMHLSGLLGLKAEFDMP